ncbi:RNA 3'-terminal phosphate cyclase [Labilithrix luteola]|nr:RNA 3'-terminal phosphate cyclase [Labilithrix luteola]
MSTLRDLLNRARWRDGGLHELEVHVLHRGAPNDRRVIAGNRITAVRANGIELAPEADDEDPIFVPYHRFLAVAVAGGAELWSKDHGMASPAAAPVAEGEEARGARLDVVDAGKEIVSEFGVVLREATNDSLLVIDGSAGEGGGQILRTSLSLSMATGKPFVLERIRAGRKKPGLMRQHLTCVKAAALVCGAEVEGATLGSSRIVFRPGAIRSGDHTIEIGTAGSISLVLQTLALPLALTPSTSPSRITVRGGTHVPWSPPFPFLEQAWLPLVRRAGAGIDLELISTGFNPAAGGEVVMTVLPSGPLAPIHLGESTVLSRLRLQGIVSDLSEALARRELTAAGELLKGHPVELASGTVRSPGPGNALWLVARDEGTGIGNVFSAIGASNADAEAIGRSVAEAFLAWRETGTSVEPHLADQLMLPIALAGGGSYTCSELTLHSRTNIEVIHAFTGHRLRAWDLGDSRFRIALVAR